MPAAAAVMLDGGYQSKPPGPPCPGPDQLGAFSEVLGGACEVERVTGATGVTTISSLTAVSLQRSSEFGHLLFACEHRQVESGG